MAAGNVKTANGQNGVRVKQLHVGVLVPRPLKPITLARIYHPTNFTSALDEWVAASKKFVDYHAPSGMESESEAATENKTAKPPRPLKPIIVARSGVHPKEFEAAVDAWIKESERFIDYHERSVTKPYSKLFSEERSDPVFKFLKVYDKVVDSIKHPIDPIFKLLKVYDKFPGRIKHPIRGPNGNGLAEKWFNRNFDGLVKGPYAEVKEIFTATDGGIFVTYLLAEPGKALGSLLEE